ncbi:hypothetical protein C8R44DRAFT_882799 [Mycena epipterygia]|nr:hypothetical protein C8R44DRAFT_882799 [Mycena epipterygia]
MIPEIVTAIWKDAAPNWDVKEAKAAFNAQFPGRSFKVNVIGLQCVGLNLPLYDALRKEYREEEITELSLVEYQGAWDESGDDEVSAEDDDDEDEAE